MQDAVSVFISNAEVDAYNAKVLTSLNTEGTTANAYDFHVGDGLASIRNLKRMDVEDGSVNAACGRFILIRDTILL